MIRIAIRGFKRKELIFESAAEWDEERIEHLLPELAEQHAAAMAAGELTMIELEFLDYPEEHRFFRIGTDPAGMVRPIRVF